MFFIHAVFQLSLVALLASGNGRRTRLTLPANAANLLSALGLVGLSYQEHKHGSPPSWTIQTSLLFTSFLDIARVRTQWLLGNKNVVPAALVTLTLCLKAVALLLESQRKPSLLMTRSYGVIAPIETCGIFGRALLLWLNPLFTMGYKQDLTVDELFALDSDLSGQLLTDRLAKTWGRGTLLQNSEFKTYSHSPKLYKVRESRKHALSWAVLVTFLPELVVAWLPRLANIGLYLAQPFLIRSTLQYIKNHAVLPVEYGYGLIGAFGIVYIGIAVCTRFR